MAKGVLVSLIIIAIGLAWLLNSLHVVAGVEWIWTIALAAAGVLTLAWGKLNKLSFLVGSFLIVGSLFSILRQTGVIRIDAEVPLLVIVAGVLLLFAQLPMIPHTATYIAMKEQEKKQRH